MGIIMRNGESYLAGDDDAFRYVSDVNDKNYGWIQYQLEDGSWVNYEQVETLTYPLYMSSANEGGFEAYAGCTYTDTSDNITPTVTFSDTMTAYLPSSGIAVGCVISKVVNLTDYTKIKFHYVATRNNTTDNIIRFCISETKNASMTSVSTFNIIYSSNPVLSAEGDAEIDISTLSGEHYLFFEIVNNTDTANKIVISNMYME